MIIKIFKIPTLELYVFSNKEALRDFIISELGYVCDKRHTINKLISYLPVTDYYRVK